MATNIDECINEAIGDIAAVSFGGAPPSLFTQMNAWIAGMFGPTGIFVDDQIDAQRQVIDWYFFSLDARSAIEGPLPANAGIVGNGRVTDVVVRTLWATKVAQQQGWITTAQRDAVVVLYQTLWD